MILSTGPPCNKELKDTLTATFGLKVTEHTGIELKYETGEQPGLFEDKDKVSLGITYLY